MEEELRGVHSLLFAYVNPLWASVVRPDPDPAPPLQASASASLSSAAAARHDACAGDDCARESAVESEESGEMRGPEDGAGLSKLAHAAVGPAVDSAKPEAAGQGKGKDKAEPAKWRTQKWDGARARAWRVRAAMSVDGRGVLGAV
eukprot:2695383-Rhodomonas_salina.1